MQRKHLPIVILTGVLFVTAFVGYLIPAHSDQIPVRVLLDNKGGKIILSHSAHSSREEQNCKACHHTTENGQRPPACTQCHVKKFDTAFIADHQKTIKETDCASCHHARASISKFSHENHIKDYAADDCQACHHDTSIEQTPQACSNCHTQEGTPDIPSLKTANHTKCADCHSDMYQEGVKGCHNCHTREQTSIEKPKPCSSCHSEPAEQLIPTPTNAFHGQCMGCHEKQGKGPFGDDACYQCHMK